MKESVDGWVQQDAACVPAILLLFVLVDVSVFVMEVDVKLREEKIKPKT